MFCDRRSWCAPFLEGEPAYELDEPWRSGCRVSDAPEVGGRRVDIRVRERCTVQEVEDIDAEVQRPATRQPHRSHDVHVHLQEVRAPDAVDSEREDALLEVRGHPRRIALEPGVDVKPALERRVVAGDILEIAVEEDVPPRE